jgi:hypothetical protein
MRSDKLSTGCCGVYGKNWTADQKELFYVLRPSVVKGREMLSAPSQPMDNAPKSRVTPAVEQNHEPDRLP